VHEVFMWLYVSFFATDVIRFMKILVLQNLSLLFRFRMSSTKLSEAVVSFLPLVFPRQPFFYSTLSMHATPSLLRKTSRFVGKLRGPGESSLNISCTGLFSPRNNKADTRAHPLPL